MLTPNQVKEIKETGIFDFLGNSAYYLNKETLIEMFKEYHYAIYAESTDRAEYATRRMLEVIND